MEYYITIQNEWNTATCKNINESQEHNVEMKKEVAGE